MKTTYDPLHGTMLICCKTTDPAEFVLIDPLYFFSKAGALCGLIQEDHTKFVTRDNVVGEVSSFIVAAHQPDISPYQMPFSGILNSGVYFEEKALDVTGYSLDKLREVIASSIAALQVRLKLSNTTH